MLNRELECLPTDEGFDERDAAGGGLTAPEFATLLSHTKIALWPRSCSPPTCRRTRTSRASWSGTSRRACGEQFGVQLQRHPLRREIIASRVVNDLVNRAGTTFAFRLGDETGAGADDIARAYAVAREVFGLRDLWGEIEALDGRVPAETQIAMLLRARILLERATRWLLRNRRRPLDIAATIARFAPGAAALAEALPALLGPAEREAARARGGGARGGRRPARARRSASRTSRRSCRRSTSSRSPRRPSWTSRRRRRSTSRSASGSSCTGCATGSSTCRGRRAGRRWRARRSGTTSTPSRRVSPPRCCGPAPASERWLAENANAVERSLQVLADIRSRRHPRPRPAVGRGARDPQPDPL